jgi:hypothetical protein
VSPVDPSYVYPLEKRIRLDKTFGIFGRWGKEQSFPGPVIGGRAQRLTLTVPHGLRLVDLTTELSVGTAAEAVGPLRLPAGSPEPFLAVDMRDRTNLDSVADTIMLTFAEGDRGGDPERYAPEGIPNVARREARADTVSDELVVVTYVYTTAPGGFVPRNVLYQYLLRRPEGTLITTHSLIDDQMASDYGRKIIDTMMGTVALSPAA